MTARRPAWRQASRAAIVIALSCHALAARADTAMTIVAPQGCPPALRERIAEQIADVADGVGWSCLPRFDAEAPFRGDATAGDGLRFWIDLTAGTEARLMLRDGRSDRFLVRRVALPHGLDEIGREEIGQIVRAVLVAVRAGPEDTLTRAEARAEVARWSQPAAPPLTARPVAQQPAGRRLVIDLGAFGAMRSFAPQLPFVGEVGLGLDVGRWGPLGGWLEAAYQPGFRYEGAPVSVDLHAFSGRAGLDVSAPFAGNVRVRAGLGAGVTRTTFAPQSNGAAGTPAAPGSFSYVTGRVFAGWQAWAGAHVLSSVMFFVDVVGADVHYDLREPDGATRRVLVPHRFQPGLTCQIFWSR